MEPSGSELDSSLPQPENPCLIVEDSQPDSVALEDDPESSYRALLARRLSSLQPTARSPVLELISSPRGGRFSQTDSQSENSQTEPGAASPADINSPLQEESQVLNICPPPNKKRCAAEDCEMDPGADSTTNCVQSEERTSQFGFLELSQSQDLRADEDVDQPDHERQRQPAGQSISSRTSEILDHKAARSEVSSSSSSESLGEPGRQLSVQALLHSQNLQSSAQQDREVLSSQEDLFDADKSVDSTVSEPEQRGRPTPTPAHTLHLLHLSGQGTLVQESLSQSSVDYVAPTPDNFPHTPLVVSSSPTEAENDCDEPMDTSLPPDDRAGGKEEPMETEAASKPHPSTSAPGSQDPSGSVLDQTLSVPSQPEFSHDVFVRIQSQGSDQKSASLPCQPQSQQQECTSLTSPLQLSVNTDACDPHSPCVKSPEQIEEDSQATQIEEFRDPPAVDSSDSVTSRHDPTNQSGAVPSESQPASSSKPSLSTETARQESERSRAQLSNQNSDVHKQAESPLKEQNVTVKDVKSSNSSSFDPTANSCVPETPSDATPFSLPSQPGAPRTAAGVVSSKGLRGQPAKTHPEGQEQDAAGGGSTLKDRMDKHEQGDVDEEEVMEEESTGGASGIALVLSQSQLLSPEPMEEEDSQDTNQGSEKDRKQPQTETSHSQPIRGKPPVSANGLGSQTEEKEVAPDGLSHMDNVDKDKSLSESSGEISFHFTLPKEGELIGPVEGVTPPLISQLKKTLRHSTPIESNFSGKCDVVADVSADVAMAASDVAPSGEDTGDGKLSLRMKLVTPVEEGSSERFSLQKPVLSEEERFVSKVNPVSTAVTSSPSVFTRVRQAHRQQEAVEDGQPESNTTTPVRGKLFSSPAMSSQASLLECNILLNSQSELSQQDERSASQENCKGPFIPVDPSEERPRLPAGPDPNPTNSTEVGPVSQTSNKHTTSMPPSKLQQQTISQQTSLDGPGLRLPPGQGEADSPLFKKTSTSTHHRHVRTIQEVRTTITRIITDVYYEDGKEVDRRVTEEREEPVVDCQVLESDVSPSRTGHSSLTSGDLGDISSLSRTSSLQQSSGGTSSSIGHTRPVFIMPPSRGTKTSSPRRGGGHQQRGHRGQRAGSVVTMGRGGSTSGSWAFVPLTPRGRARRGRPPSRSSLSRGGGVGLLPRLGAHSQIHSSDDGPYTQTSPPRIPVSPTDPELSSRSDSLRSSPEEGSSARSSFVGLRVVAKWSSNRYFYSGRIMKDAGEGSFRLRFDDGYECEVAGKDILLCDPIPLETEVTALLKNEYFSIGVVKGHKTEGQDLFYSVEMDGQRQWYNRTAVILSLEQGNKLREQHSLGPYEPTTPLTKASDISLDNLVEGKRRRRGTPGGQNSSSCSPRTPTSSSKRKLMSEENRTPSKRGRRGGGARAAPRVGVCDTSGSGTDLYPPCDVAETHGPLPQNTSLFMGFAFMLTASSESDRMSNKVSSDHDEDYVQTGPYNKAYTESQLQAGGGFILPDFNE
ncbi:TP53-binding protein 1, partial [Nematolebias whitei]|uniref:TP53-binding protein 1 n=1 Tax=Nematolebias whitei TaxID=451745 RepID=UPI00189C2864